MDEGLLLEASGITVRYGDFVANHDVRLSLRRGEIHAVLGENGAGKTTLMNVLAGLQKPSSGRLMRNGAELTLHSPADAIAAGIGMVHQHSMLVERMTVVENVVLGRHAGLQSLGLKEEAAQLTELSTRAGLGVEPLATVSTLSPGERQRVEILKLLRCNANIIILDEPTSVLAPLEIAPFLTLLRNLAASGRAIVLITHKLDEVVQVAHTITVLRAGKVVANRPLADADTRELAELMVGSAASYHVRRSPGHTGQATKAIDIQGLEVPDNGGTTGIRKTSLHVCAGEILGIAGVDGNGQHALALTIAGLQQASAGTVQICGIDITHKNVGQRREMGLAYLPEDRHHTGLVLDLSVAENIALHDFRKAPLASRWGLLRRREITERGKRAVDAQDIRLRSLDQQVRWLSGGNQQKVVLARELASSPRALVVEQPCKGLDVSATLAVHTALMAEREKGTAVLYISTELEHLMETCDRIVVMSRGKIAGEITLGNSPANEQLAMIGRLMAGTQGEHHAH